MEEERFCRNSQGKEYHIVRHPLYRGKEGIYCWFYLSGGGKELRWRVSISRNQREESVGQDFRQGEVTFIERAWQRIYQEIERGQEREVCKIYVT